MLSVTSQPFNTVEARVNLQFEFPHGGHKINKFNFYHSVSLILSTAGQVFSFNYPTWLTNTTLDWQDIFDRIWIDHVNMPTARQIIWRSRWDPGIVGMDRMQSARIERLSIAWDNNLNEPFVVEPCAPRGPFEIQVQ